MEPTFRIAFLGAGGIAQAHVYALDNLKYYYLDAPNYEKVAVASPTPSSREGFAARFGFQESLTPDAIWSRDDIDTLYISGTNDTHTPQLLKAIKKPNIKRIYLEKPAAISRQELNQLEALDNFNHGKFIMIGHQFLQKSAIRKALAHWKTGVFGQPIHFRTEYLHSSYLDPTYRKKNLDRLQPIPRQGAAADLGSHCLSLLTAFLGEDLAVKSAFMSGNFDDIPKGSDLCTTAIIEDQSTGAVGTFLASRVSQGTGDHLVFEIYGTEGTLRYTTFIPDYYETYLPGLGWQRHEAMSDYLPASKFSSVYVPSGWLRALVHNHYLFLGGDPGISFIPDLHHGILVQKLIQGIADYLNQELTAH